MRVKILGAVVVGLLFVTVAPLSQTTQGGGLIQLAAKGTPQGAAAAAIAKPKPTPTPAPTPPPAAVDCTLIVPADPLTAKGLSTPFQLTQARGNPACHESDAGVQAFVQAAVIDPASGQVSIYNPLVVDRGTS